ncbi:MAG: TraR/DksA family transcriptional regulator [Acidobacteria bacterium]|nr:TraR/DksA family transcriptional regulator [Acidobacteriota bacterium]
MRQHLASKTRSRCSAALLLMAGQACQPLSCLGGVQLYEHTKCSGEGSKGVSALDAALDRLDSGDYGICVDCGAAIASKRLVAIPWASRCIACQERISSADECGAARRVGCLAGTEDGNPFGRRTGSQER